MTCVEHRQDEDLVECLRAEVVEWQRRAEVAEAIAAERLARAESAERALATAEAALQRMTPPAGPGPSDRSPAPREAAPTEPEPAPPPRSWLERWRRYTDSIT
jgi:hypothetical protein